MALSLALLLLLGGCGPEPAPTGLDGTSWELRALNGQDLAPGTTITLVFDGVSFFGYGGCNAYGRLAAAEGTQGNHQYGATEDEFLAITDVAIADGECPAPPGVMEQEEVYVATLQRAAAYRLEGERLEMLDAASEVILVFAR